MTRYAIKAIRSAKEGAVGPCAPVAAVQPGQEGQYESDEGQGDACDQTENNEPADERTGECQDFMTIQLLGPLQDTDKPHPLSPCETREHHRVWQGNQDAKMLNSGRRFVYEQ